VVGFLKGKFMSKDSVLKTRDMLWKYVNLSTRNVGKGVNYKFYIEALKYNGEELKLLGVDVKALGMPGDEDFKSESKLSAFAGLFGFSEDFSDLIKPMGFREITIKDCLNKVNIMPETMPGNESIDGPGGMVSLVDGVVILNIGLRCADTMVELIKDCMGIDRLISQTKKVNVPLSVKVVRNVNWDHKVAVTS
jgi:hypothetical protein